MDFPVFVDTSLGTHLALVASGSDTVGDFKRKIMTEHALCFLDMGEINVRTMKVRRKGSHYHLSDSMLVRSAFGGIKGTWFLYVDADSKCLTNNQARISQNVCQIEVGNHGLPKPALLHVEAEDASGDKDKMDCHRRSIISNISDKPISSNSLLEKISAPDDAPTAQVGDNLKAQICPSKKTGQGDMGIELSNTTGPAAKDVMIPSAMPEKETLSDTLFQTSPPPSDPASAQVGDVLKAQILSDEKTGQEGMETEPFKCIDTAEKDECNEFGVSLDKRIKDTTMLENNEPVAESEKNSKENLINLEKLSSERPSASTAALETLKVGSQGDLTAADSTVLSSTSDKTSRRGKKKSSKLHSSESGSYTTSRDRRTVFPMGDQVTHETFEDLLVSSQKNTITNAAVPSKEVSPASQCGADIHVESNRDGGKVICPELHEFHENHHESVPPANEAKKDACIGESRKHKTERKKKRKTRVVSEIISPGGGTLSDFHADQGQGTHLQDINSGAPFVSLTAVQEVDHHSECNNNDNVNFPNLHVPSTGKHGSIDATGELAKDVHTGESLKEQSKRKKTKRSKVRSENVNAEEIEQQKDVNFGTHGLPVTETIGDDNQRECGKSNNDEVNDSHLLEFNSSQHESVDLAEEIPKKDLHSGGENKEKSERKKNRKSKMRSEDISTVRETLSNSNVAMGHAEQHQDIKSGGPEFSQNAAPRVDNGAIKFPSTTVPSAGQHALVDPAEDVNAGNSRKEKRERKKARTSKGLTEDFSTELKAISGSHADQGHHIPPSEQVTEENCEKPVADDHMDLGRKSSADPSENVSSILVHGADDIAGLPGLQNEATLSETTAPRSVPHEPVDSANVIKDVHISYEQKSGKKKAKKSKVNPGDISVGLEMMPGLHENEGYNKQSQESSSKALKFVTSVEEPAAQEVRFEKLQKEKTSKRKQKLNADSGSIPVSSSSKDHVGQKNKFRDFNPEGKLQVQPSVEKRTKISHDSHENFAMQAVDKQETKSHQNCNISMGSPVEDKMVMEIDVSGTTGCGGSKAAIVGHVASPKSSKCASTEYGTVQSSGDQIIRNKAKEAVGNISKDLKISELQISSENPSLISAPENLSEAVASDLIKHPESNADNVNFHEVFLNKGGQEKLVASVDVTSVKNIPTRKNHKEKTAIKKSTVQVGVASPNLGSSTGPNDDIRPKSKPEESKSGVPESVGPVKVFAAEEDQNATTGKMKISKRSNKSGGLVGETSDLQVSTSTDHGQRKGKPQVMITPNEASAANGGGVAQVTSQNSRVNAAAAVLKEPNAALVASSDSTECSDDTVNGNQIGKKRSSKMTKFRVAVRKVPDKEFKKKYGTDQLKGPVATPGMIFYGLTSSSSEDEHTINKGKHVSKSMSDNSSSSASLENHGEFHTKHRVQSSQSDIDPSRNAAAPSIISGTKDNANDGRNNIQSQTPNTGKKLMPLGMILRNSSSYRKAKLASSQSQSKDSESQPIEIVPDSQTDHSPL
ncbi:hypothetical protein QJS10_CPB18g00554 [Acorus calamus]|uniref:Uncharacterized protein n=1 Tax=Acorus calamus TaxID=4465 RepID=A0AAV9CPI0_ACOCL|nr:hypothetical protein QJS10_CPB18g00554 [Acorus calamus]